ncbi:hypothetical protein [Halomonas sp. BM-2019]|uniref:hypothetical protein n=1 Tax=Halomonas sp. BM-2019 TaxID=2811227 RepID=UPI001B3C336F|nr:MAG: hypothetical protein J5F18_01770 [Halomonas sp. BM-2019]
MIAIISGPLAAHEHHHSGDVLLEELLDRMGARVERERDRADDYLEAILAAETTEEIDDITLTYLVGAEHHWGHFHELVHLLGSCELPDPAAHQYPWAHDEGIYAVRDDMIRAHYWSLREMTDVASAQEVVRAYVGELTEYLERYDEFHGLLEDMDECVAAEEEHH